jgi:hypothetical protein
MEPRSISLKRFAAAALTLPFAPSATEVSRRISECNYGWTAAYEQRGPNITVRIQLNKDANVTDAELAAARARWEPGIRNKWSRRFACCDDRTATTAARCPEACTLMFSVEWVTSNAHHVVWIQNTAALPSAKRE